MPSPSPQVSVAGRAFLRLGALSRGELPAGGTVVDCPCGAGPALRALGQGSSVDYVGVDLSPAMIRRARKRIAIRGLTGAKPIESSATDIPLPGASADLFLSYWGLHCFEDPAAALVEAARILRPAGRLVGACFVLGRDGLRQRLLVRPHTGDFGPIGTQGQVEDWLAAAGIKITAASRSGPMFFFEAAF